MAEGKWLRWYDGQGQWLPTLAERAEQAEGQLVQAARFRDGYLSRVGS